MEDDNEGQPNDISSSSASCVEEKSEENVSFQDERKVEKCLDNNVSSGNEKDIDIQRGKEPEGNNDLKKEDADNSKDLTENNPCPQSSLGTTGNPAEAENEKSGNEPNSTSKLVDKSRKDILDKGCVTDDSKSSEINSSIDITEPKSPEIGFRKKNLGQLSPFSFPVKSPQKSEKSVIRSPELGGRKRLKVHVFDRELGTVGGVSSNQEQSGERKDGQNAVEESSQPTPTVLGKDDLTEVKESTALLLHNAGTTSPCLQEKEESSVCDGSKDLDLSVKENDNLEKISPSSEDICKEYESEKCEDSVGFLDSNSSAVNWKGKESSSTEEIKNSVRSLEETHCTLTCSVESRTNSIDSSVNTGVHGIIKPEDKDRNSHEKKEEDVESNTFLNEESESNSVQCSADISKENNYDSHIQKVASKGTPEGKSFEEESSSRQKELMDSKEYPSVEKVNSLEINEKTAKKNDEFCEAQPRKVDNGNSTDLDVNEKKIILLNKCQNKIDPSNKSECQEIFTENKNSVKVVKPLNGDEVDMEMRVSVCDKEFHEKEVNKSGNASAKSECMEKEFHELSEIGNFSEAENNLCKKVGETKSVDSDHSVRKSSQEGDKKLIDCSHLGENKKACEVNDSKELVDYKKEEPMMNKGKVNNPNDFLSLSKRKSVPNQEINKVEMEDKDGKIDTVSGKEEENATGDERFQEDNKKIGIDESDQGSVDKSDNCEKMRTFGEGSSPCVDTDKESLLNKSETFEPPDTVPSSLPVTSGNEILQVTGSTCEEKISGNTQHTKKSEISQVTGSTCEENGSGNTQHTKNKKRSSDIDPDTFQDVSKHKRSRVALDTPKNSDHNRKGDVETSSPSLPPTDMRIKCVDISNKQKINCRRGNVVDMVCKKCRDIWNDEVLRIIFKGTESVTVNSKITYGAIVCINDWINRNIGGDKEEAITQVFERTDLGSNIAQLNISRLDEWLEELLQKGKNRCCKVFTAVYQPAMDVKSHKTKAAAADMPKAAQVTQSNVDTKKQNPVISKRKKLLAPKGQGPLNAKSQSPTGIKSQSPVTNRGQCPVIATCQGLPKGRVYLVPAPAVASVLPSALASKSIPSEESTVLPKSASSLMKPCKIILKNPVRLGPKGSNQNLNNASDTGKVPALSKLRPPGSSVGLTSEENMTVVSNKYASNTNSSKKIGPASSSSIYQSSLKARNSRSPKAAVHGNTDNSREYHEHKVVSRKKMAKKAVIRKGEHERVKSPVIGVESMIYIKEPAIREMLKALNLDIKDVNIYSSYCSKPVTNKTKFECPSEEDKRSPCYFSMLKERSALNGNALIAFDLLLYEFNNHHSIASFGYNKSRFVTKRELLTLQSIFILNPETPDISLFYEVFIQILLSRKKVLLIPDSHTFLVVTEDIRKEYNRAKSKDLSIQILNENWDPCNIYSADDVWLKGQNPEEVTNRDVISIFCTWRNLEKNPYDKSLSKALHSIWQFHNVKNGDYYGICFRLYTKFIRIVYEEKELELAKVFLDEPFSGGFCTPSKKFLQNLINSNKRKICLPNFDDKEDFKGVVERCEELEKMAHKRLTAPVLRDLCAQVIILEEKLKEFTESNEVIGKRLTNLLGKREKLLKGMKGSAAKKLVQSMRSKIAELHKVAQKRRQEHSSSEGSIKRIKRNSDMNGSDVDPSCKEVSPHIKELIKDLLSKGVKPDKVQQVIGIVSGIIKEETVLKLPSEKWILSFAQMNS